MTDEKKVSEVVLRRELIKKYEEVDALHREVGKKYYSQKFYEFNEKVLGWPDIYERLHRKICDFIVNNVKKKQLLLLLPRGTFKSSIVTVGYTLWRIAQDPSIRVLIANATYPMSVGFLSQVKDHLEKNDQFKRFFGDLATGSTMWREDQIAVAHPISYRTKEPTVTALGLESNYTGKHFDVAILDDLVNRDNIRTRDRIEGVVNFYKDTLDLVDRNKFGHKEVIVIGTTWHQDDLYARIQDKLGGYLDNFEVMRMPAFEGDWGTGELLFEPRLGWEQLEMLRKQQGSGHFAAQYLLDPVPLDDAVFKSDFIYYDPTDIRGLPLNKFIAVDPALSERKEADYSAMVCIGVDKNNVWYILDLWRDKVDPKRLLDQIFYWDDKHHPVSIGIETTAFQRTLQFFAYEEMKRRNKSLPIKDLKHAEVTKDERIRGLQPRYETGQVFHNKQASLMSLLEDELRRFPRGRNDDLIDALASMLELANPPRVKTERVRIRAGARYPA